MYHGFHKKLVSSTKKRITNPKLLNGSVLHISFNLFNQHDIGFGEEVHA